MIFNIIIYQFRFGYFIG